MDSHEMDQRLVISCIQLAPLRLERCWTRPTSADMGSPHVSPPRALECPFSGLSLTMAPSCPMLPLGLEFTSSPRYFCYPELQSHPEFLTFPLPPKAVTWVCLSSGKGLMLPWPPSGIHEKLGRPWGGPAVPQTQNHLGMGMSMVVILIALIQVGRLAHHEQYHALGWLLDYAKGESWLSKTCTYCSLFCDCECFKPLLP